MLGEKVYTQIAILAGLSGGGDADDLTWTTLQDQEIAKADVVAGDSDGMWPTATLDISNSLPHAITDPGGTALPVILLNDNFLAIMFVMRVEGVEDTVRGFLNTVAERVVVPFVVVVTHTVSAFFVNYNIFLLDIFLSSRTATFVFYVVVWLNASSIVVLGVIEVVVASINLNINFCIGVTAVVISVVMT